MATSISFLDIGIALVVIVAVLIFSRQIGFDLLDYLGITREKVQKTASGIPRIFSKPDAPRAIKVDGRYLAVDFTDLKEEGRNKWTAEVHMYSQIDRVPRIEIIKSDEIDIDRDSPRELFGSNVTYMTWVKGGIQSAEKERIKELEKEIQNKNKAIAVAHSLIEDLHASEAQQRKWKKALEGVDDREKFRKGPGWGGNEGVFGPGAYNPSPVGTNIGV